MGRVALLTVHGMGEHPANYADEMTAHLQRLLGAAAASVEVRPVYYQHLLKPNQQEVWRRVKDHAKVRYDSLRRFILFGLGDAAGLENSKEDDDSVYEQAQTEIARTLLAVHASHGAQIPVVFLAHSLGCQVLSSYLYDAQKRAAGKPVGAGVWRAGRLGDSLTQEQRRFLGGATVHGLITTGCNIPIFVAAHQRMHVKAIAPPRPDFQWLNLYDPDDALGWPLQPLEGGYETLVEDRAINAGQSFLDLMTKSWNPLSHSAYWTDDDVLKPLAALLTRLAA